MNEGLDWGEDYGNEGGDGEDEEEEDKGRWSVRKLYAISNRQVVDNSGTGLKYQVEFEDSPGEKGWIYA